MGAPPGYRPSAWVHLLHQLPRADFQLRPVPSGFAPQEQEYQQALLLVAALAGLGLGLSLIFIAVYLIRFCCCRPPEPPGSKTPSPGGGCVTWSCIVALLAGCIGIGIGFYGNSETSDGVSQLSSALLHANHTLSAIDHLVLETVERLGEAVRTELTTLEEVLEPRTELVAAARGARRQAEAVAQQLQGLAFWQGVPLSPLQVAEDVSFVEEYRWLAYVLLLLLELLVCLFTLLGLAKQSKWLVIVMTVMSLLVLVLSWGSMGLEAATAVGLSDFCSNPDPYVLNLTQEETGLSSEADSVPASSGQHPLPAAGPGERSCASVPFSAEASAVLGGDSECDRRKLSPVGGTAALPWPAQGLRRSPAGPVRRRPGRPALPAALLPAVRGSTGHRALQPAPRLGPLPTQQESKRFVQWQSSI
ncbi:protein tweety homolog 1 isoform X10 [Macaca nemestrina]|uniref:protein tweety homolog 1 isoform X13 n=1 Tax=Macaca mulatta TaxID=9544 RepID=UPI0007327C48|nr:protein tweety homolog 1 isoform X13 [Macaca mulatta]